MQKIGRLLLRTLPRITTSSLLQSKPQALKVGLSTLGLSFSAWFTTSKVFPEEMIVLETDDDLRDGEVR